MDSPWTREREIQKGWTNYFRTFSFSRIFKSFLISSSEIFKCFDRSFSVTLQKEKKENKEEEEEENDDRSSSEP